MESGPSQYKKSTEQERFSRQLDRDLARKSQRLSQSTIRKLITNDTSQWAKAIYDQKLAQNNSTNASAQQNSNQPSSSTVSITETSEVGAILNSGPSVASSAGASTDSVEDIDLPIGSTFGDILYWDPAVGESGDWVILPAPEDDEELKALTFQNGDIEWNLIEATSTLFHPWKISLRETDGGTEFKVELNSRLYSGLGSWDNIDVDGLNSWSGVSEGYIILFGVVENGVCTEASIEGPQSTLSDRIDFVDEEQNGFAVQLGFLYQSDDSWQVRQNAFHNFTIIDTCVGGKLAIYPIAT
jgi:hypothetical protein